MQTGNEYYYEVWRSKKGNADWWDAFMYHDMEVIVSSDATTALTFIKEEVKKLNEVSVPNGFRYQVKNLREI